MKSTAETDIAIIGGGIAGLWLLNRLRQQGYSAILLECDKLGGGQTHKSQGIIHGGMKYALQGLITQATTEISNMPSIWQACLTGQGFLDLREVPILSAHQYVWTTGSIASKVAGFFASMTLRGQMEHLHSTQFPEIFRVPEFEGTIYQLDEPVIDVSMLIRELVKPQKDAIFHLDLPAANDLKFNEKGEIESMHIQAGLLPPVSLFAKKFIFTAGLGNETLLASTQIKALRGQRRPLHMVLVKHDFPFKLYAHCLGLSATPRMTITTHHAFDGKTIWYIGGQIAEEGINRDAERQCEVAKQELTELFPWLNFSNAQFAAFRVDRAEAAQPNLKRPDSFSLKSIANYMVAWPTKLAFAPALAETILHKLEQENIRTGKSNIRELSAWPVPPFAKPMWDILFECE